jgi:hypothetical protein
MKTYRDLARGKLRVTLLGGAFILIGPLTAQSAEGKKPASHVYFMDGCSTIISFRSIERLLA